MTEHEREVTFGAFVFPNDTTGMAAKEKSIEQDLNNYQVTPTVAAQFEKLKEILTAKDTLAHYIIVYKKDYVNNIYKLYD